MQQLDPFATHVAKAFLRHAIHKKNTDMQILDTILILLRKSYVVFESHFRTSYSLARTQVQYDSNGRFRESNGKTDVRESVEKQLQIESLYTFDITCILIIFVGRYGRIRT